MKDCYPDEIIEERLSSIFLSVSFLDYDIKLDDFDEPFKQYSKNIIFPLSTSIFKTFFLEFSETILKTDSNIFLINFEEENSFKFQGYRESVDFRKKHDVYPGTFSQMSIITSGNTKIFSRSHLKFFVVIIII